MTEKQSVLLQKIAEQLTELIYINGIIATELIKITENTAAIRRGEEFLNESNCISEHNVINRTIIDIIKQHIDDPEKIKSLETHVLKHVD